MSTDPFARPLPEARANMSAPVCIEIKNLSKRYGSFQALNDLSLSVMQGEVFGFVGPNGAGKTTTLRILMGMLVPNAGSASIRGLDCLKDRVEVKRQVGYLPDVPVFYDYLKGWELLRFVGQMHGIEDELLADRANLLMTELSIRDAANDLVTSYSLGMKKKMGLALALIHDPEVLILDEPTAGLDPRATRQVRDLIQSYADSGRTVVLSTHLLEMAERHCHRVAIIHQGRLLADGQPRVFLPLTAGAAQGRSGAASLAPLRRGLLGRAMAHKEALQLVRDEKTLHMAIVLPPVLSLPLFMLARKPIGERLFASPTHLPALAFLAGAMAVMLVSNLVNAEGKAPWLLFTLPRSLSRMLAEKALVWVPICLGYASLVLAYGLSQQALSRGLVFGSAYCFFGLTLLTLSSVGLGLHTVEPLPIETEENRARGGPSLLLLGVLIAAFGSGFYGNTWLRISFCVLFTAAAYGIWQDASRRLPYLLEPDLRPASRIGVTDGVVCVLLILLLEVFGARLVAERFDLRSWPAQGVTFVAATSIVGVGASFLFWRRGLPDLRGSVGLTWGVRPRVALQQGLSWAAVAVVVAVVSALTLRYWPWLHSLNDGAAAAPSVARPLDWLILLSLTCIGSPVVEELLFRGMIYRGLRESLSPRVSALFAAVVFAAIHPGIAFVPLFLLSLFAAASFERSRSLVSPMLVHVAYNTSLFIVSGLISGA